MVLDPDDEGLFPVILTISSRSLDAEKVVSEPYPHEDRPTPETEYPAQTFGTREKIVSAKEAAIVDATMYDGDSGGKDIWDLGCQGGHS